MKNYILVCAHSDPQLLTLIEQQPFFALAFRHQNVRRVFSLDDLRGQPHGPTLYLLPGHEQGTREAQQIVNYWAQRKEKVVALTEDHVDGADVFVPDEEQLAMAHHQTGYVDFPKYFGPRRPAAHAETHH